MNIIKKGVIATTLAATALATTPAMANDYRRNNDNTAAIAIGAGILGIAIGAIAASGRKDRYDNRRHVRDGRYYEDGYYYDRSGARYNRGDWERRYNRGDRYDNRRGYDDRYYQRRGY